MELRSQAVRKLAPENDPLKIGMGCFHFETGPLLTLFYPTTVAFVNCQLHQTFSPAFVVFFRTNLRKDPLPYPGQKPENISGVYTILPRFGAKLKAMGTAGCRS